MQPTVGRIVHYQAYGTPGGEYPSVPRAAIVTEVPETQDPGSPGYPIVGVFVLNPTGAHFNRNVPYSETPQPGHWSWPPRN